MGIPDVSLPNITWQIIKRKLKNILWCYQLLFPAQHQQKQAGIVVSCLSPHALRSRKSSKSSGGQGLGAVQTWRWSGSYLLLWLLLEGCWNVSQGGWRRWGSRRWFLVSWAMEVIASVPAHQEERQPLAVLSTSRWGSLHGGPMEGPQFSGLTKSVWPWVDLCVASWLGAGLNDSQSMGNVLHLVCGIKFTAEMCQERSCM